MSTKPFANKLERLLNGELLLTRGSLCLGGRWH
jgi:hypothetical protein